MSLDKAIEHGKEKRKKYHGSKIIDKTYRNHGSCPWYMRNRKHKIKKQTPVVDTDYDKEKDNDGFDKNGKQKQKCKNCIRFN